MSKKPAPSYADLRTELDAILAELQSGSLEVDAVVDKHKRALQLIDELDNYLQTAEQTIKQAAAKQQTKTT